MGAVYAVTHDEIGKRAALKVIHRRLLETQVERMLVEARVVNQCRHPNIVDIFETGSLPDGRPFIVMERLDGQPLSNIADDGKILPDRAVAILSQVAEALIAAHDAGIVHRDLKLDNIFLVAGVEEKVKLLDWGIAKEIANDVRQTVEGQLVGTPQYLAPEQARGAAVSPQTDVYSLGVVAWELFLEQLPFEAETAAEVMAMHLRNAPPVPSEIWPDIPPELEDLLLAMLEKTPDHRPTMRQVVERLALVRDALAARKRTPVERKITAGNPQMVKMASAIQWSDTQQLATLPRRWLRYAVGAFAAVVAVVLLLVARADDSDAATMPPPSPLATTQPAPVAVQAIAIPIPVVHPAVAAPEPAPVAPVVKKVYSKKAPAAPHRPMHIDPNGTIPVYK